MYVAVKGGEQAISQAHKLQEKRRRGDTAVAELSVQQIHEQLPHIEDKPTASYFVEIKDKLISHSEKYLKHDDKVLE